MSVRGTLGGVFAATAVLIIGWQAGAATGTHTTAATGSTSGSTTSGGTSTTTGTGTDTSGGSASGSTSTGTTTAGYKDGTYTGTTESTRFGDVQVQVTISGGKITDVTALHLTDRDGRSVEISNRAAPILKSEVIQGQSAQVNMVSGATYTSDGYLSSVQSALDRAK